MLISWLHLGRSSRSYVYGLNGMWFLSFIDFTIYSWRQLLLCLLSLNILLENSSILIWKPWTVELDNT